ncbi:MAG: DUF3108 domain-containing protein [Candidatus Eisenbacteria bacterium]|nr:DUF3108 domain-containing protein [Candidatus Eisenbacteria bacterium]
MPEPFGTGLACDPFMTQSAHSSQSPPLRARTPRALACLFAVLIQCAGPAVFAQDDSLPDSSSIQPGPVLEVLPASPEPFRAGESLRFSVRYGFISAGSAWLEVPEVVDWHGHPSWRLVARAESNGFFDKVYKVRNRIESVWDQQGHFSWRYFEDRHEGGYTANDTLTFEPDSGRVRYKNGMTYPVPPQVQDALSAFYFTRFQALPLGGSVTFDYHASRKSAPMEVKVLGRQRIKTPAGRFNCIVIEPLLKAGGIFKNKGRLVIWLTDDERRMPVQMRSKVLIGSISVTLQEAKTGS